MNPESEPILHILCAEYSTAQHVVDDGVFSNRSCARGGLKKKWIKYKILLDKIGLLLYFLMPGGKKWGKVVWKSKMWGMNVCFGAGMNTP